jgi:hypothetical protein
MPLSLPGRRTLMHARADLIDAPRRATEVVVTASVTEVHRVVTIAATGGLQQRLLHTGAAPTHRIRREVRVVVLVVNTLAVGSVRQMQTVLIRHATMVPTADISCADTARNTTVRPKSHVPEHYELKPMRVPLPSRLRNVQSVLSVIVVSVGSDKRRSWQQGCPCRHRCNWCLHAPAQARNCAAVRCCPSIQTLLVVSKQ